MIVIIGYTKSATDFIVRNALSPREAKICRSPDQLRGLNPEGLEIVYVHGASDVLGAEGADYVGFLLAHGATERLAF